MSIARFECGPHVHALGWTRKPDWRVDVATVPGLAGLSNPLDFDGAGNYWLEEEGPPACPSVVPLAVMRGSGVARARSAARATVFAALLGKRLLSTLAACKDYDGNRTGVAVASSSAITPIAWEFETTGLNKGWDKTDTMLLPSSIPSAITTQTSAAFDTHAAAIAFQDGALGVCAAMEYAYLSFVHRRSDHFLVLAADELCRIQCSALAALDDWRPWMDGAAGLLMTRSRYCAEDWQLELSGKLAEGEAMALPGDWADAAMLTIATESSATLFSAQLVPHALHHLLINATGKAVLSCRLPGRGSHVLGFRQAQAQR